MRIVYEWLRELVDVPGDPESIAAAIALRGFEVAEVQHGRVPVIDFEITANRPDCLSHLGIAREASAIWNTPLRLPAAASGLAPGDVTIDVRLEDATLCPRYCAQVFDVTLGPSPGWLADRLEAAGVRPINNVVDVTNYVMLEIGQPMHAFDFERVRGRQLVIRRARPGETLRTLDGVDRALDEDMLVIADAERASAVGGVMGGAESEIHPGTTRIVLESAYFQPASVRRSSKKLGLKTEASTRFERGGDINAPPAGLSRAAALLEQIGAGRAAGPIVDHYPAPRARITLDLRADRITRLLGVDVPRTGVPGLLTPLGFEVESTTDGWAVRVPSYRVDVAREADLVEEVGRHFGFDRIPASFPALHQGQPAPAAALLRDRVLRQVLMAAGFSEAMTFAFIEREAAMPFVAENEAPAGIANPLSEKYAVLRPSLLPGLVDACVHNRRRGRKDIQLFEAGSRFAARSGEGRAVALVWSGAVGAPHWSAPPRAVDFFDVKGVVERVCSTFGVAPEFVAAATPFLAPGRSAAAEVHRDDGRLPLAVLGQLLPEVAEARGFPDGEEIFVAEIDVALLFALAAGDDFRTQSLPRFPSIVRDVSVLVPDVLPAAIVRGTIRSSAPPTLVSVTEFDRYTGKGVPPERVSLSLRLTFRAPDRTLTDDEVQAAMETILAALRAEHGAEQR